MYEELVNKIRALTKQDTRIGLKTQEEAASAIEELSRQLAEYKKFDGFLMVHGMFGESVYVPNEPPKEKT